MSEPCNEFEIEKFDEYFVAQNVVLNLSIIYLISIHYYF